MTKQLATLCLLLITVRGMAQADNQTRNYNVHEFNKIITHGGGDLRIHYSDQYSVQVTANNAHVEPAEISVSSNALYIRIKDSVINGSDITICIGVPSLIELVQNGGGKIVLEEGFSPQNSFQCEIKGGGDVDVSELSVNSFYASIEGGGIMLLHAERELEGTISGGGVIKYSGDPNVTSYLSGGGVIRKK